ncbi:MAG: glycosyltransferase family 1 protein, partial [Pseudanabaenales cyanobacterium]|nr:glycosyltransferase family 1 protein [Pseudanabaenales cyanobacterium]
GPAIQVTEKTGFKVQAYDPEQTIREMATAMTRLVRESELRLSMGRVGQKRVSETYSWKVVGERLDALYQKTAASCR